MLVKKKRIPILKIITFGILPSWLKVFIYRINGAKIGKNVKFSIGSIITSKEIIIGDNAKLGFFSVIQSKSVNVGDYTSIGMMVYFNVDYIHIGKNVEIRENNLFGGMDIGKSKLQIGDYSHVHQKCFINTTLPVRIGSNTAIGGGSYIFTHSSWQSILDGYPCTFKSVIIGDNVWISWNTFILPGVEIGSNTLIAASSTVSKSIPKNCLASGNPAKVLIPSGNYPRSLVEKEKNQIVNKILNDYICYLENNLINCEIEKDGKLKKYKIKYDKNKFCNYIFADTFNLKLLKKQDVFLSFSIDDNKREYMRVNNVSWIDFANYETSGSSIYIDELLKFLKHYGLRFNKI